MTTFVGWFTRLLRSAYEYASNWQKKTILKRARNFLIIPAHLQRIVFMLNKIYSNILHRVEEFLYFKQENSKVLIIEYV